MIHRTWFAVCLSVVVLCGVATAQDSAERPAAPPVRPELPGPKHLLRYKFEPGETIRWKVEHRAEVRTTVSGTTQTAETTSNSVKVWRVTSVDNDKKQARFVHSVDSVDMRQVLTGRQEVHYNSQTDAVPPPGFEDVARDVGVPLSEFTIDLRGYVLRREEKRKDAHPSMGEITVPLPDNPVAIGETWSQPNQVTVKYKDGSPKQVKTRQDYKLVEVDRGVATITLETTIITPITDPAIDAQLIQQVVDGKIRFDIENGRVISQQTDIDKHVVGFQGEASSLHYVTRFKENLTNEEGASGPKVVTGPPLPPTSLPPVARQPAGKTAPPAIVAQPTTGKKPTAQTARAPAAKSPQAKSSTAKAPAVQPKKPATASKPVAPNKAPAQNKTARRTPPTSGKTTPPQPPSLPTDVEPNE